MRPALRRLWTPRSAHLIRREARNANVVLPLEHHLDVAWLKRRAAAELAQLAGCSDQVIDKIVGDLKEDLCQEKLVACWVHIDGREEGKGR